MNKFNPVIFGLLTLILAISAANAQDDKQYQELAVRLVQSASVKPGDVVIVEGGKHMIPLMEAVAIEVQKAGGMPTMFLDSDRVTRSFYTEVPDKYLEQEPRYMGEWFKQVNVLIALPTEEDSKALMAGVPEERFAKIVKSTGFMRNTINSLPVRLISINFPTPQNAAAVGMDFAAYQKLTMEAINADYQAISVKGNKLKQILQNAKQIRVTNPAGTDITFSPAAGREIIVNDGIVTEEKAKSKLFMERSVNLPGGRGFLAPRETYGIRKVVITKGDCKNAPMDNISFDFKNGQIQNFRAGSNGNCFEETMKPYTGPKDMFATFSIGLNPAMHVVEDNGAFYRSLWAAGLVYISIGDNRLYGGTNDTPASFGFRITNATVTIDGQTIVKDGKLML